MIVPPPRRLWVRGKGNGREANGKTLGKGIQSAEVGRARGSRRCIGEETLAPNPIELSDLPLLLPLVVAGTRRSG